MANHVDRPLSGNASQKKSRNLFATRKRVLLSGLALAIIVGVSFSIIFQRTHSGSERWFYQTGNAVNASPSVVNGIVYVASYDKNLYALDAASGRERWFYRTGNIIA